MSVDKIAEEAARNWFTIAPKYRTKQRLAAHISDAINYAQIADMIVDEHNGGVEDNGSPEGCGYRDAHSVQFCRDATMLGEGCPLADCHCVCHDPEGD